MSGNDNYCHMCLPLDCNLACYGCTAVQKFCYAAVSNDLTAVESFKRVLLVIFVMCAAAE